MHMDMECLKMLYNFKNYQVFLVHRVQQCCDYFPTLILDPEQSIFQLGS